MTACIYSGLEHGNFFNSYISQGSVVTQLRCVGIINNVLLQIYWWICQWKNFENQSTFGEVTGNIMGEWLVFLYIDSRCIAAIRCGTENVSATEKRCWYHPWQPSAN